MPTNAELKALTQEQLVDPTGANSIPKEDIKGRIDAAYDYTDQQSGTLVSISVVRDGGSGTYTVTDIKNDTGLTFTATDSSTNGVGITASGAFFSNPKTIPLLPPYRGGGNPHLLFDNGYLTTTQRLVVFYNVETQTESRPGTFTVQLTYIVYP